MHPYATGGHFTVAAFIRLISRQDLVGTADTDLFLEDEPEPPAEPLVAAQPAQVD